MPFNLATEFFKKKKILPTEKWNDVSEAYSAIAFTISSITRATLLADIKNIIEKQLELGISPEAFKEQFRDAVIRAGWNPNFSPYRIALILSQNCRNSYQFGRWEQMTSPDMMKRRAVWQWIHGDSPVPREHHLQQHLKCFPADAEIWRAIHPSPFGCRCRAFALSDRDMKREGLSLSTPPRLEDIAEPGFTQGFPANLEQQRSQLVADAIRRLPPNLARLLQEDVEFQESLTRDASTEGTSATHPLNFAYNPNQPRDERGRFGSGSYAIAQPRINPERMEAEEIATYIDAVSDRARQRIGDTSQGDWFLRELARDQGFDGWPHVITKEQMDEYVANGERELFRGLDASGVRGKTGEDLAEQFRAGDLYAGVGLVGSGTYTAYGRSQQDVNDYAGVGKDGAILRMTLKSEAKIVSLDELRSTQRADPIANTHRILRDPGRYAAFKGYDAIDLAAGSLEQHMLILNRTALRVQDTSLRKV